MWSEVETGGWWLGEAGQRLGAVHLDSRGRRSVPIGQSAASWVGAAEDAAILHLHQVTGGYEFMSEQGSRTGLLLNKLVFSEISV